MQFRTFKPANHQGWSKRFMRQHPEIGRDKVLLKLDELVKARNLVTEVILYPVDTIAVFVRLHDGTYRLEPLSKVLLGQCSSPLPLVGDSLRAVQSMAKPLFLPKPKLEW